MVFSCFVSYKSYHKKGTLDFKQRMVKELSELLLTINHSFSTLMQIIHTQLYERTKIIAVIVQQQKRLSVFAQPDINTRGGWGNSRQLCKPETKSRVCITIENSPNASSVYIRLCKHRKKVFYCFYKINFPRKNAKRFVRH